MIMPIVDVRNVKKQYGKKNQPPYLALNDISFLMQEGEFVAVMGPSGSGKTTLLNVISTLDSTTQGSIRINGTDISGMKQDELADFRSQQLGFIFQDFNLLENLTVYDNIALPLSLQDMPSKEIAGKVQRVLSTLGIADIAGKYPAEISGGQKQRTAAARAVVHEPALILGDEPTGSLDSKNAISLLEVMRNLNENQGISIMMVTHDAFSASYCGRILFIQDGRLYKELRRASTQEIFYSQILAVLAQWSTVKER